MNNLDKQYQELLQDILDNGVRKGDRTGTGTLSVFGRQIRHKMSEGFPLLTTKKMYFKGIVTELLWFLRGDTNIKYLVDNDCHIWDGDAYKRYLEYTILGVNNGLDRIKGHLDNCLVEFEDSYEHFTNPSFQYGFRPHTKEEFVDYIKTDDEFAKKWGELGPVYGKQWRSWGTGETVTVGHNGQHTLLGEKVIDQIANLINDLKTNPDSRRLMVSAWNPADLESSVLPPCHYGFQVYTRELSLRERCDAYLKWSNDPKCVEWKNHIENEMGWDYEKPVWVFEEVRGQLDKAQFPTRTISLMFNMRSNDVPLGLPFNLASYGLLLEILAKEVNMIPDELIASLGDAHIYVNQIDGVKEQLTREPYPLPTITLPSGLQPNSGNWDKLVFEDFYMNNYQSHPSIKMPLSN